MADLDCIAVEFRNYGNGPLAGPFSVLFSELDNFLKENGDGVSVDRVYLRDNRHIPADIFRSYGKNWWGGTHGQICRIGAGAYGDMVVWKRGG